MSWGERVIRPGISRILTLFLVNFLAASWKGDGYWICRPHINTWQWPKEESSYLTQNFSKWEKTVLELPHCKLLHTKKHTSLCLLWVKIWSYINSLWPGAFYMLINIYLISKLLNGKETGLLYINQAHFWSWGWDQLSERETTIQRGGGYLNEYQNI